MIIRSLGLGLAAATIALAAMAAPAPHQTGNEGVFAAPVVADVVLRRNGSADGCRDIVWPYVPQGAACAYH
jgi:hypothetical protein